MHKILHTIALLCFVTTNATADESQDWSYSNLKQGVQLLENGTFDANVDQWTVGLVFGSTGTIEWSSTQGQPPGSLRIVGDDQNAFPEECFTMTPGVFSFSADAFMDNTASGEFIGCGLNLAMFNEADDCTGDFATIAIVDGSYTPPSLDTPQVWQNLEIALPLTEQTIADLSIVSFRPLLEKYGDFNSDDACVWDNASMTIAPFPITVPTMNEIGLGVLGVLLALAALTVLRRTSA